MAEFEEVVKQFRRMCETQGCDGCPMYPACNIGQCRKIAFERPKEFEAKVMQWAQEHHEPVYPTWGDWLAEQGVVIKDKIGENKYKYNTLRKVSTPIPADIAEKLEIKPKEEV